METTWVVYDENRNALFDDNIYTNLELAVQDTQDAAKEDHVPGVTGESQSLIVCRLTPVAKITTSETVSVEVEMITE